jgi:hypothetical protein
MGLLFCLAFFLLAKDICRLYKIGTVGDYIDSPNGGHISSFIPLSMSSKSI